VRFCRWLEILFHKVDLITYNAIIAIATVALCILQLIPACQKGRPAILHIGSLAARIRPTAVVAIHRTMRNLGSREHAESSLVLLL